MNAAWLDTALAACRLLGDAANGRPVSCEELPDQAELLGFSKVHRIETLISSALRCVGADDTAYGTLHTAADTAAFHQIKNDLASTEVIAALAAQRVNTLPLKGAALQAVYPDGWIRTATDTDLYIPVSQYGIASDILTKLGFVKIAAHDGEVCFRRPPRTTVELHTTLGGYSKTQQQVLEKLSHTPFTVHEHYVYTLFHLYKHFLYAGAGVRLFWDMYCLSRAVSDRNDIQRWLEEMDLLSFDRAVQTVNGILFDGDTCTDAMSEVIGLILQSGTFGTGETYHAIKNAAHPITQTNRFRVWLGDYGFDRIAMTARYPVLEKHLWLYPLCVLRRIVHGMIFKRTVLQHAVKTEHAVDRKYIERVLTTMQIL